jgi:hypothetical protein
MAQPNFTLMWQNFPDHARYPTLTVLFTSIGGQLARNINVPGFGPSGNTCAVRMSRALNYGTMPISSKQVAALKLATLKGGDGMLYLFRVRELNTYLRATLGVTPQTVSTNFGSAFAGLRGIVSFTIEGWSDASGHFALWDGTQFKEPAFDDYRQLKDDPATPRREPRTTRMTLWEL